jgi:hypothetical protein
MSSKSARMGTLNGCALPSSRIEVHRPHRLSAGEAREGREMESVPGVAEADDCNPDSGALLRMRYCEKIRWAATG